MSCNHLQTAKARCGLMFPLLVAGVLLVLNSNAALFDNGSFETGAFSPDAGGWMALPTTSTALTSWTVINGVAWGRSVPANSANIKSSEGNFFLDLTDYRDAVPYGGVSQTFDTAAGQQYKVTFDLGTYQDATHWFEGPVGVQVSAAGNTATKTFSGTTPGTTWGSQEFLFTATGNSTTLSIVGNQSAGGKYIGLDNIAVTVVPEPYEYGLITVLGLLGLFMRERFSKKTA